MAAAPRSLTVMSLVLLFCYCAAFNYVKPFNFATPSDMQTSRRSFHRTFSTAMMSIDTTSKSLSRHDFIATATRLALAGIVTAGTNRVAPVSAQETAPAPQAEVTKKVALQLVSGGESMGTLVIGLYGKAAPQAVENFLSVVETNYRGGINYDGSGITRVEKGKRIDLGKLPLGADKYEVSEIDWTGRVRRKSMSAAEGMMNSDFNLLLHDQPGVVSMRRGGGTFEFTIAPAANPDLDNEDMVMGQVVSGLDVMAALEGIPVTRDDPLGSKSSFASAGKGFDPRAKLASLYRPLRKITVTKAFVTK
ncbi:unnamed protein product [Choristocarpus tenellus]